MAAVTSSNDPSGFWPTRIATILLVFFFAFGSNAALSAFTNATHNEFPYRMAVFAGIYVILAVSLNLINGITGQFSVGHAAFYMVGAYVTGILGKTILKIGDADAFAHNPALHGWWLLGMVVLGALCAAIAGFVVGLPSLRLRGDYLAIVTLGFGEILRIVAQNINMKEGNVEIVSGAYGIPNVPKIFDLWMVVLLAAFAIGLCRNLLKTAHGLPFLSVREDEVASSAMGVDVTKVKVTAFVIGAALAGAAGALFIHYDTYASPLSFKMEISFLVLTMVVLGGTGSITGSTIGAILLYGIPEILRSINDSHGRQLEVTAGGVTGAVLAVIGATFAIRWIIANVHDGVARRRTLVAAAIGVAFLALFVFGFIFDLMPAFREKTWNFSDLRMAILALTLIIVMMLRPQGIMAHHELSLDRLFGRKPMGVE